MKIFPAGTTALPTGAATAAKQPALGTAGSASADVITVQGAASMKEILVQLIAGTAAFGKLAANAGVNIGDVQPLTPTAGFSGQFTVTTGTTAVQLNGGSSQAIKDGVEIVCDQGSAGHLLIGWATGNLTSTGRRVYPGTSAFVAISDINKVWVGASANASTGSWSAT